MKGAILALGETGDKSAIGTLMKIVLSSELPTLQNAAITALGDIGDKSATETLIQMVLGSKLATTAMVALGKIRDKRAVAPLVYVMLTNEQLRPEAAEVLEMIGHLQAVGTSAP